MPIVALVFGAFVSCLSASYERPAYNESRKRNGKRHGQFKISWKGNANMGMITALLMAGTGVYRA